MLGLKESLNSSSLTKPAARSPIEFLSSRDLERAQLGPFSLRAAMYGVRQPQVVGRFLYGVKDNRQLLNSCHIIIAHRSLMETLLPAWHCSTCSTRINSSCSQNNPVRVSIIHTHFTDKDSVMQRSQVTCSRPCRSSGLDPEPCGPRAQAA